jgi:hypothetical protein
MSFEVFHPNTFTKTEALKRLRKLAATARRIEGVGKRCRAEIGTRTVSVRSNTVPVEPIADADDLDDFIDLDFAAKFDDVTGPGMVVHIYITGTPDGYGGFELTDVLTGWMGTKDAAPVIIMRDGRVIEVDA